MSTIVDCPTCTRKLNVPEELLGRAVRCPDCGGTFAAGAGGILAPEPPEPDDIPDGLPALALPADAPRAVTAAAPLPPPAANDPHLRPCPCCGERIETSAVHCRFCGEDLAEEIARPWDRPYRPNMRRDCDPHRGVLILILGLLSLVFAGLIGLPLGIIAWVLGHQDLKRMNERSMDPEGRGLTKAGWICGILGTLVGIFSAVFLVAYFGFLFGFFVPAMKRTPRPVPPPPVVAPPPAPAPMPAPPAGR
jgi:hypothetical protein